MTLAARIEHDGIRDEVAIEEPLEIRVGGEALAVTMRTPGNDDELALGFLVGEGLIDEPRAAGPPQDLAGNIVEVEGPLLREPARRRFYATSSCGICGKGALEEIAIISAPLPDGPSVERAPLAAPCPAGHWAGARCSAALPTPLQHPGWERPGDRMAPGCSRRRASSWRS